MIATSVAFAAGSSIAQVAEAPTLGEKRLAGSAGVRVIYESNAAGGNAAVAAARGLSPEDITYLPTASISLQQRVGRQFIFLQAEGDIERHDKNRELDSANGQLSAGGVARLGPCQTSLIGGFSKRRTATSELLNSAVTKNIATQESGTGQLNCQAGAVVTALMVGRQKLSNSATAGTYVDSSSDNIGMQVGLQSKQAGTLALVGSYSRLQYDSPPVKILGAANQGYQLYAGGLMYRRMVGRRLDGQISASYSIVDSKAQANLVRAWTSETSLNYRATTRINLTLNYRRGIDPSADALANFNLRDSFGLSGTYALTKRVDLRFGGAISQSHLKGTLPLLRQVREDKLQTLYAGGSLKIGRNLSLELNAAHSKRDTDLPEFDENSDNVSLALMSKF